jgi:hypothetical protein
MCAVLYSSGGSEEPQRLASLTRGSYATLTCRVGATAFVEMPWDYKDLLALISQQLNESELSQQPSSKT